MDKKRIVVTDSGLGGMDIAAKLFAELKQKRISAEIIYVNALPQTNLGYNKMPDTQSKVKMFDKVLTACYQKFQPDMIAVACNTLSALLDKTTFIKQHPDHILNIIDLGVQAFFNFVDEINEYLIVLFGTETTIDSGIYQQKLLASGLRKHQLKAIACPGLASQIEFGIKNTKTLSLIKNCTGQAMENLKDTNTPIIVFLGCTHYGYAQPQFKSAFSEHGFRHLRFFNPNTYMVEKIISALFEDSMSKLEFGGAPNIKIVSKATIVQEEMASIAELIAPISPESANALMNYELIADLF